MIRRFNEKTPSGAEYFEMHYFDKNMNYTSQSEAYFIKVLEFDKDDNVINETLGYTNKYVEEKNQMSDGLSENSLNKKSSQL